MRLPFLQATVERPLVLPAPTLVPTLPGAGIAARYYAARMGGDFYDFLLTPSGRLVFLLLDIAGKRREALEIATAVQELFRKQAPELFQGEDTNQSDALTDLGILINRTILKAAEGVCHAPAFLGSFDPKLGMLSYVNAGHIPALLRDAGGLTLLQASGIPLGLFSHATHDAAVVVVQPGAAVLLVSKGLVESREGSEEFGLERVIEAFQAREFHDAREICDSILKAVEAFIRNAAPENDITALALLRAPGPQAVVLP
ncbi:MAG TPA: SpoIIE family protein phosphatase [Terriglobales bacterium]|nr:SpoIIE family protein phosphatase [Terriglobales bacterium]